MRSWQQGESPLECLVAQSESLLWNGGQIANLAERPKNTTGNEHASHDDCVEFLSPQKLLFIRTCIQLFCDVADCLREQELITPAQDVMEGLC